MQIYVINLPSAVDRLARLKKVFATYRLTFQCVKAIEAEMLDDIFCQRVNEDSPWQPYLSKGEIACFLSHKKALQCIAHGEDAYGIIMEDDIVLSSKAIKFLQNSDWLEQVLSHNPQIDIIKIETQGKKVWLGKKQTLGDGFSLARLKSVHIMAAGYIISKQAALRLIAYMERYIIPFDHFLFNPQFKIFENFMIYQLDPALLIQAGLESTLEKDRYYFIKKEHVKRGSATIYKRELKRIFQRATLGFRGFLIRFFSRDSWKKIKFEP